MQAKQINRKVCFLFEFYTSTIELIEQIDLSSIVEQLDAMFDKEEFEKAYEFIEKNRTNELFQSYYIRWRIAR